MHSIAPGHGDPNRIARAAVTNTDQRLFVGSFLGPATLEVMDAMTWDAILNWASRFLMPWRRAIQPKSE
jgi:hypothetical protein